MPCSNNICFLLVFLFTYWPCKTIKLIAGQPSITCSRDPNPINSTADERPTADNSNCSSNCEKCKEISKKICVCVPWRIIFGIIFLAIMGIGTCAQLHTCFSRQNPYSHWVEVEDELTLNENLSNRSDQPNCKLKYDINKNLITGYFFPYTVIGLLALWMYLIEPIYTAILNYQCNITNLNLDTLIEKLSSNQVENLPTIYQYVLFSFIYIVFSQALNIGYLYAFGILEGDVVIETEILSCIPFTRTLSFFFSAIGYVAFDLLYIQVILRYTYQSDLLIEYLNSIKFQTLIPDQQNEKLKSARTFIKQLNDKSFLTGIVMVIAGFTAFSCIINLTINSNCPQVHESCQVVVVILRFILWLFIVLYPFYKTAKVNETSHEVGMNLVLSNCDATMTSKVEKCIASQARLISISIQSSHPNALLLAIIFTIMLGSGIKYLNLL